MVKNAVIIIRTAYKITNYSVWTCQHRLNVSIPYYATKQTVTTDHSNTNDKDYIKKQHNSLVHFRNEIERNF